MDSLRDRLNFKFKIEQAVSLTSLHPAVMINSLHSTSHSSPALPALASGDRLTRAEFERRCAADPQAKKAELIEGIVYVASPLRFAPHAEPHSYLNTWLGTYVAYTPGVRSGIEPTVRLDLDNELQPDIVLMLDEAVGGKARLTRDGYVEGNSLWCVSGAMARSQCVVEQTHGSGFGWVATGIKVTRT